MHLQLKQLRPNMLQHFNMARGHSYRILVSLIRNITAVKPKHGWPWHPYMIGQESSIVRVCHPSNISFRWYLMRDAALSCQRGSSEWKPEDGALEVIDSIASKGLVGGKLIGVSCSRSGLHKIDALPRVGRGDVGQVLALRIKDYQLAACTPPTCVYSSSCHLLYRGAGALCHLKDSLRVPVRTM